MFRYLMNFPSKMQCVNLQCSYLPTRQKLCVRAASKTGENYLCVSYPQAQKANEVFVLYSVCPFFAANCLISVLSQILKMTINPFYKISSNWLI